jgi:hypothetical protein
MIDNTAFEGQENFISTMDENGEYQAFVDKFKAKKTTDDCYTPPAIYEVIKDWACAEYGIDPTTIVRPFYPGGDYERYEYPDGCTVLDNPPFSILSKICEFYLDHNIKFFMFAPSLTAFSARKVAMKMNHLICDCDIVYDNGALVKTSFATSYGGDIVAQTAPELTRLVNAKMEEITKAGKTPLPKYEYPDHIVTAAMMQRYAKYGIDFKVRRKDCINVPALDHQRELKKSIFGSGLLLSDAAAAERAAAERAAAERAAAERAVAKVWKLSDRELDIIESLGGE